MSRGHITVHVLVLPGYMGKGMGWLFVRTRGVVVVGNGRQEEDRLEDRLEDREAGRWMRYSSDGRVRLL